MSSKIILICFCLIAAELYCQVLPADLSTADQTKPDTPVYQNHDTVAIKNLDTNDLLRVNNLSIPDDLFLMRLKFPADKSISYYNDDYTFTTLSLTSSIEYQLKGTNRQLADYLSSVYLQTRPSKLQEILGIVNISGAAALAGYQIWKTYIKKKK
jgi:hypothetical protein